MLFLFYVPKIALDKNQSGRNFKHTQRSDNNYKDKEKYVELSDGNNEDTSDYDEYYDVLISDTHVEPTKWNRLGNIIDRQFGIFSGGFNLAGVEVSDNHLPSNLNGGKKLQCSSN